MNKQFILILCSVTALLAVGLFAFRSAPQTVPSAISQNAPPTPPPTIVPPPQPPAPFAALPPTASTTPSFALGGCSHVTPSSVENTLNKELATGGLTQALYIGTSASEGRDFVIVPQAGYCLFYPSGWQPKVVGVWNYNLSFNASNATGTKQPFFLDVAPATSSLENSDKVTVSYEESVEPLVDPTEILISKQVLTVGDKRALFEVSTRGSTVLNRYFLEQAGKTYMFEAIADKATVASASYKTFLTQLKNIIPSMYFISTH